MIWWICAARHPPGAALKGQRGQGAPDLPDGLAGWRLSSRSGALVNIGAVLLVGTRVACVPCYGPGTDGIRAFGKRSGRFGVALMAVAAAIPAI